MELWQAIASRIDDLWLCKGLTLNSLAYKSGITQSTLDNLMKGNSKNPKLKTLILISAALDMTIIEFLNDEKILNATID